MARLTVFGTKIQPNINNLFLNEGLVVLMSGTKIINLVFILRHKKNFLVEKGFSNFHYRSVIYLPKNSGFGIVN